VGTAEFTLTFSEAVTGVSGQATSGDCTANVQLVNTDNTSACLPIDATSTDSIVWTLDPAGEMDSGSYTLTVVAEGIADKSGNALAAGPNPISFAVADALSTVLNELDNDLTSDGIGGTLITDIKAAARIAGEAAVLDNTNTYDPALNTLLVVIPKVFDAALDVINSSNAADEVKEVAVGLVLNSLMDNVNSTSSLSTARVDTITGFTELLQAISETIGKKSQQWRNW